MRGVVESSRPFRGSEESQSLAVVPVWRGPKRSVTVRRVGTVTDIPGSSGSPGHAGKMHVPYVVTRALPALPCRFAKVRDRSDHPTCLGVTHLSRLARFKKVCDSSESRNCLRLLVGRCHKLRFYTHVSKDGKRERTRS